MIFYGAAVSNSSHYALMPAGQDFEMGSESKNVMVVDMIGTVLSRLIDINAGKSTRNQAVTKFQSSYAPDVSIQAYLSRIQKYARCSESCFVVALIYIDRMIEMKNIILSHLNVHRIVVTSILVSAKFLDDFFYNNAFYAKLGGISVQEMNSLELEFLMFLGFSLQVSTDLYATYHSELKNFVTHSPCAPAPRDLTPKNVDAIAYFDNIIPRRDESTQNHMVGRSVPHQHAALFPGGSSNCQQGSADPRGFMNYPYRQHATADFVNTNMAPSMYCGQYDDGFGQLLKCPGQQPPGHHNAPYLTPHPSGGPPDCEFSDQRSYQSFSQFPANDYPPFGCYSKRSPYVVASQPAYGGGFIEAQRAITPPYINVSPSFLHGAVTPEHGSIAPRQQAWSHHRPLVQPHLAPGVPLRVHRGRALDGGGSYFD